MLGVKTAASSAPYQALISSLSAPYRRCGRAEGNMSCPEIVVLHLTEWRKAETLKLPVFTGVSEDSAIRQSANYALPERTDV